MRPETLVASLVLCVLGACGYDQEALGGDARSAGMSGADSGAAGGSGTATAGGSGTATQAGSGGSAGSSDAATGDVTCDRGCEHAVACLTGGALCPTLTAQDADAVASGCHEICAARAIDFEALSERADDCGLALLAVVDNSDLASRPNRDLIERCAPTEACHGVCDSVGSCATDECENRGAVSTEIFGACIEQCSADASWVDGVNDALNATGCRAALLAYDAAQPGTLPPACVGRD